MSGNPCTTQSASPLDELATLLKCRWKNIDKARERTQNTIQQLSAIIEKNPGPDSDSSVVVHGSLARYESTQGSDLDWTLLVDGVANAAVQKTFLAIKGSLHSEAIFKEIGLKKPGPEGTFGALSFSQPMMHYIGGEEDSNSNTTRRVLLLLEAQPIGNPLAFDRVRKGILWRYLDEDRGLLLRSLDGNTIRWVPLFLLNDFARYWRTMAVDFAYKQYDRGNKGYALRSIKLGVSRKLLFASGLLACFWCDPAISKNKAQEENKQSLISSLVDFLRLTPLERVAQFFAVQIRDTESDAPTKSALRKNAKDLFDAYNSFLGLLNNKRKRNHLDDLKPPKPDEDLVDDEVFKNARLMRRRFQQAIEMMFLGQHSALRQHSIEKGIF